MTADSTRPVLRGDRQRLWRAADTLQLGRNPGQGAVLAGLDEITRRVLPLLDGTRPRERLLADAERAGCPAPRTTALLGLLEAAGMVQDSAGAARLGRTREERERLPAAAAARQPRRVLVLGGGRVGSAVAGLLAVAGVGAVDVVDDGTTRPQDTGVGGPGLADLGRPRGTAARAAVTALAPSVRTDPTEARPDLVVLAPAGGLGCDAALERAPAGSPLLAATVREAVGVVGPLTLPGVTACLRCLDLHRAERDPDWPMLAVQTGGAGDPGDGTLAAAVAAQAAMQALQWLDGGAPATLDGTLEVVTPGWRWRRRSWVPHPDCGCRRWRTTA